MGQVELGLFSPGSPKPCALRRVSGTGEQGPERFSSLSLRFSGDMKCSFLSIFPAKPPLPVNCGHKIVFLCPVRKGDENRDQGIVPECFEQFMHG